MTTSNFRLRPYQGEALDAIREAYGRGVESVMIELATGLGKTEIFTQLAAGWQDGRALIICPQITLVQQAAAKIRQRTGDMPAIEQGELWANESPWARADYVVASKASLTSTTGAGKRYERFQDVGLVVVDECHLSATGKWLEMLTYFRAQGACVLGVTATPKRHDQQALGQIYDECVYQMGIADAVKDGWLVPAVADCVQLQTLDLTGVGTSGDDFKQSELDRVMEDEKTILEIADVTSRETFGQKTVIYCASVDEAEGVAGRLRDCYGINAAFICADERRVSKSRRREVLESFARKSPDAITHVANVGILTTGWDYPALECIVQARPTKSLALYSQIFGRGTRALPGVVDFEGSTPESRRAAIAASEKPSFRMVDLVDTSMEHKIVTATDVLGGNYAIEVVEKVKADLVESDAGPVDVSEALAAELTRQQEERERIEREKRKRIEARAKYDKVRVDPYSSTPDGRSRSRGRGVPKVNFGKKYKGVPWSEVPRGFIDFVLDKPHLSFAHGQCWQELKRRKREQEQAREVARAQTQGEFLW